MRPPAPGRVRLVRVRPGVGEPVPVRRPATQITALLQGLGGHRGPDPDPGPDDLPLGRQPQRQHRLLVILHVPVDPAAYLRHPQLDTVMLEQRRHRRVLAAVERPLILPDHDRVPPPVRIRQRRHQRRGLRTARPHQCPALPRIEELRHDHPLPRGQHDGLSQLPGPRGHRILPVLSRDPPVKREPQATPAAHPRPVTAQALRPGRQHVPARPHPACRKDPHRRRAHPRPPPPHIRKKQLPFP
jgi:hypothetical protein